MPSGPAAVDDGMIERREVGEGRRLAFARRVTQMVIEAAMRGLPRRFVYGPEPLAEPLAHQRMGVERFRIGWICWRQQPHLHQPCNGAPPLLIAQINKRVGQSGNRWLRAERLKAVTTRRAVEQADGMEDGELDRLPA